MFQLLQQMLNQPYPTIHNTMTHGIRNEYLILTWSLTGLEGVNAAYQKLPLQNRYSPTK